jgi:flagellin
MSLFSINTNLGALAALQALDQTQEALTQTQNEVSTGQKVANAADNPAIYSIANTLNANIAGLSAVSDSLNFGAQVVSTATSAVSNINTVLQSLQSTVTDAGDSGENLTTLQNQVNNELQSINNFATDSTFSGVNLLVNATGNGITSNSLNVVQSVDGSVFSVSNQVNPNGGTTNSTLTDTLGLTNLNVTGGSGGGTGNIGANIAFGVGTDVYATFDPSVAAPAGSSSSYTNPNNLTDTNAAAVLTTGTGASAHTYTFEFVDDYTSGTQLQSSPSATNTVIAVHFNSNTDSTNQIEANFAQALSSNGFGVVQQQDGSLNIVGRGLTEVQFGQVSAGTFNSGSDTTQTTATAYNGVTVSQLSNSQTAVTAVTNAVNTLNGISANLGAAAQQITGIQNFTSALSSALTAGVGALTDADLAAESAQLTSLQTKQQLATQSLSIANQQPSSLLSLFKGS